AIADYSKKTGRCRPSVDVNWSRVVLSSSALRELSGGLGDVLALEARDGQLVGARLPAPIATGHRCRSVGRAARDLLHVHQLLARIRNTDNDHAQVEERGVKAGDRRFLAAVLCSGAGEDAANLADQRPFDPQAAGLVEEVAHLGAHIAEARR